MMGGLERHQNHHRDIDQMAAMAAQAQRDSLLNQARQLAMHAGTELQAGIDSFPMDVRVRYPQLTQGLYSAAQPFLQGARFGNTFMVDVAFGGIGAAFNDMHAAHKIRENMRVLDQCQSIADSQRTVMQACLSSLATSVQLFDANLVNLQQSVSNETQAIFSTARRTVGL